MRSRRSSISILLVAGLLGVLVFLATRSNEDRMRAPAPPASAEPAEPRGEPGLDALPSEGRTAIAPLDGEASSGTEEPAGWRVCVVDASTSAAVAGATVSVLDLDAIGSELYERGIGSDTLEGLRLRRERAVEGKTGADGCARFSVLPAGAMVEARSGAAWAFTVVNQVPDDRCITLRLAPDRSLQVRVVDPAGTPVGGVPVALRRRQVGAQPSFTWKWTDTLPGTGIATFLHFQRRLEQGPGWHALLAFPVRDQTVIPVDEGTSGEPPPTLVLPDTGRVRVRVRTPEGSVPDLEGVELQLDAFERTAGGERLWPDGPWARPRIDAAGEAFVPWIGLGLELRAALVCDGSELAARSLGGPARPGEEIQCELVLPRPSPADVTGRFVLNDGRAWPAATVEVRTELFPLPARGPPQREIAVEAGGRFRVPVHEARPADGTRAFRFSASHPDDHGEVIAIVPLDEEVPPEGLDLGDVLLDYGELLASGRVVDVAGRPIGDASLSVHSRTVASGEEFWPGIRVAGTAHTTADGEFALHLPPGEARPDGELRLVAAAPGFVGEDGRDVLCGERDVEIVLVQAGALAGSLELDRGLANDDVILFLSREARQVVMLRRDSTFEVTGLLPGTYSLEVRRRGASGRFEVEPAALVEDLLVRAGETCRDPRIQALRVESVLATLKIRVLDRASTPLRGAAVSIVGLANARATLSGDDGVCRVRCEALPVDLEVSAFGHARRRLVDVSADQEVVLDAGWPIRLRTEARPSGKEPLYLLGATLYTVDESGVRRGPAWGPEYTTAGETGKYHFDEHGELALRMPAAGAYECEVHVTVISGGVGRGGPVELSPEARILVLESPTEQLFELVIPEHAVREAVERALR